MDGLISRQAAIDIIEDFPHGGVWNVESMEEMVYRIKQLPSAQPGRKTGKWIYITDGHYEYFKCDQCEKHSGEPTPFCRYCGADMREGQDEQRT